MSFYEACQWPKYGEEELEAITRVLSSNQLFAQNEVRNFEGEFAHYVGASDAAGVMNATAGLHLVLAALGIGKGDEVIVTSYSWVSTASSILMQNAIPIFCDIESESFGIDPIDLAQKITHRTKAVVITHVFGYPAKIDEIIKIAQDANIYLIEDASHAHGSYLFGKHLGTFGDAGVFSLHQRKNLSVGDGGMVIMKDLEILRKIKRLRSFGDTELSYNYRMTEFAAAIGRVRLKRLDKENQQRRELVGLISKLLEGNKNVLVRKPSEGSVCSYHALLLEVLCEIKVENLDKLLEKLQSEGMPIRKTWEPLHKHPHFNSNFAPPRGFPWMEDSYEGVMKTEKYSHLDLPVVNHYCPNRLLELYVHPTIPEKTYLNINSQLSFT